MAEWSSPMNDSAMAESSLAISCGAMAESPSASTDSPKAESYPAIFCGGVADLSSAIFCGAMAVIFCGAMAESSLASGMGCCAMTESSSATDDSLMVASSSAIFGGTLVFCGGASAIFCGALADSSPPTNDSPMVEASSAILCGAVGDSSLQTNDCQMAEIKDIAVAESSSPINDEVCRLFGSEKTTHKVSGGAANVLLWRMKKIWAGVFGGATTIWVLFVLLGYRMLILICRCLVTVLYLGPAATNFINKAFVIMREINRGFAEINRCFSEIKRGFAEIKKGVAVLRRIRLGWPLGKLLIAFFLVCICILYVSSTPHIREVSTPPQVSISKDLIVNVTIYMRDNEGFVVQREFMFRIAIVFR